MQAAQVEQFGQPLVPKELDIPTPGPGQILVRTEACGVCHTDLHAASGDWPLKPALPFTPGHEGIGIVAALGAVVTEVKEGDRVGVPWLYLACGHCEPAWRRRAGVRRGAVRRVHEERRICRVLIVADPNYGSRTCRRACRTRCGAIDLCRHHLVQGPEGDAGPIGAMGGRLGHGGLGHLGV
jgi:propanol-preferring alcohol dehydrogenase